MLKYVNSSPSFNFNKFFNFSSHSILRRSVIKLKHLLRLNPSNIKDERYENYELHLFRMQQKNQ